MPYNLYTMQVYVELAFIENFCMDFTLLYCAKTVARNPAPWWRTITAASLGACFAVVFPLVRVSTALSVAIKILSSLIISLLGGKFNSFKAYFKLTAWFLGLTFLIGGGLIAVYKLFGWEYLSGQGFILSKVPVGLVLFGVLMLILTAKKLSKKLTRANAASITCKVHLHGKTTVLRGFYDSGNRVYSFGEPVSVLPLSAALKIATNADFNGEVKVNTVTKAKRLKTFTADKLEIEQNGKTSIFNNVKIAVTPFADRAIIHPDFME